MFSRIDTKITSPRVPTQSGKNVMRRITLCMLAGALAMGSVTSASAHDDRARNTLLGAGLGAAGGALLTNGDVWGAVGGAAAGGLIGNVLSDDHHDRDWSRRNNYRDNRYDQRRDRGYRH